MRVATGKPRIQAEKMEMRVLSAWLDLRPGLLWCHVPNESQASVQYRTQISRLGLKAGVPDVLIFTPAPKHRVIIGMDGEVNAFQSAGTALELKAGNNRATDQQRYWLAELEKCGWAVNCLSGATACIEWLKSLGY